MTIFRFNPDLITTATLRSWKSAIVLMLFALPVQAQQSLTFVSWGGAYTRSQMLAFVHPFEQRHGIAIDVQDYNGGLDEIRRQARSLNIKWDVVDMEPSDALRGCREGLLLPIDPRTLAAAPDGTPARDDFLPGSIQRCAVGTVVWSTVIAYNNAAFKDGPIPHSLQDFFDVKKFPGPRGLRRTPKGNLEWALLSDGVKPDQVYPLLATERGLTRAFAVLDALKPNIVWWDSGTQAPRLLENGRVVMTSAYSGRIYTAMAQGRPDLRMIWDHQIWNFDLLAVLKHSRHKKLALEFVRSATRSEQLAEQARHIPYGPVRHSALPQIDPSLRRYLPTAPDNFNNAMQIDAGWWSQHFEAVNARFQQWLQRPIQVPRRLPH